MEKRWFVEGDYLSFDSAYYMIIAAERSRYTYKWDATITAESLSSSNDITDLKPQSNERLFQVAFGINEGVSAYLKIPADKARFGLDQNPEQSSANREIGDVDFNMSPFEDPSLEDTEFFTQKQGTIEYPRMWLYNKTPRILTPELRFIVNHLILARLDPSNRKHKDLIDKLNRRILPSRPLTLDGMPTVRGGRN